MRISDWSSDVCSSDLDFIGVCHRHWASAAGMCPIRSSATSAGPARLATSACSQTALQAAVTGSPTAASWAAHMPASISPVPAVASHDEAGGAIQVWPSGAATTRSEEHTSELQSLMRISYAVFCLKKKKNTNTLVDINKQYLT